MCVHVRGQLRASGVQRTTYFQHVVPGMKLLSSGLVAKALTRWAISLFLLETVALLYIKVTLSEGNRFEFSKTNFFVMLLFILDFYN